MDMSTHCLKNILNYLQKYFVPLFRAHDNKFAALNSVPFGVEVVLCMCRRRVRLICPCKHIFVLMRQSMGQFERTFIIAEPGVCALC